MNLVINSYHIVVYYFVSVSVFVSSIFVSCFRINFYGAFKVPWCASSVTFAIKQAEIVMVVYFWKLQLRYESACARTTAHPAQPPAPRTNKPNTFIGNIIMLDYTSNYGKRLAAALSVIFISGLFDVICRAKQIQLLGCRVAFIQDANGIVCNLWHPISFECCFDKTIYALNAVLIRPFMFNFEISIIFPDN